MRGRGGLVRAIFFFYNLSVFLSVCVHSSNTKQSLGGPAFALDMSSLLPFFYSLFQLPLCKFSTLCVNILTLKQFYSPKWLILKYCS